MGRHILLTQVIPEITSWDTLTHIEEILSRHSKSLIV